MEKIKQATLEVQVYKYSSSEEMKGHVKKMQEDGYEVIFADDCYLGKEHKASHFLDKANWHPVAEFCKSAKKEDSKYDYEIQSRVY